METNFAQFLTFKQKVFCDEYLKDKNATAAALKAGYSNYTALSGYLMTLPKICLYLQQEMEVLAKKVQVNHEMILSELCKIAFGNTGNYFCADGSVKAMDALSEDAKAALLSVSVSGPTGGGKAAPVTKFRMYNKLAALDKIAKHLDFYNPKVPAPEKVYVYVDKDYMHHDDSFDDYSLVAQANREKLKTAEREEEDRERAFAEQGLESISHTAEGNLEQEACVEIPKNTEVLDEPVNETNAESQADIAEPELLHEHTQSLTDNMPVNDFGESGEVTSYTEAQENIVLRPKTIKDLPIKGTVRVGPFLIKYDRTGI